MLWLLPAGSAPMPRMPREKSLAWWRYMKGHSHLQIELGEDIFVPQILILKRKETGELLTTVTWPQAIPEVFPPCDLLAIDKVEKRYLGLVKRKEIGLVSASPLPRRAGRPRAAQGPRPAARPRGGEPLPPSRFRMAGGRLRGRAPRRVR